MDPAGLCWALCFRTHHEITMYLPGKWGSAPSVSDGDWGQIEDILCPLAKLFRGAGSKNYCAEILHFIHQLKKIWPPAYG